MIVQKDELDAYWLDLRQIAQDALSREVPAGSRVVYFDYPVHSNVGDLLIWKGTETWLKEQHFSVIFRLNILDKFIPNLPPDVIVLCHGGGNFGDLYTPQRYREKLVRKYHSHKIVMLPQTIFYQYPEKLTESAKILNEHPNLAIFVRDETSLDIAQNNFTNARVTICPDMATFLYPVIEGLDASDQRERMYLIRTDIEKTSEKPNVEANAWIGDWQNITGSAVIFVKILQVLFIVCGGRFGNRWLFPVWERLASYLIRKAIKRFAGASDIVTSRLHGQILGSLMGLPVKLLNNNYGKNRWYFEKWYSTYPLASLADAPIAPTENVT